VGVICPAIRPATTAPRPPNIRRRDAPLFSAFPQTSTPRRKLWVKGEHRVGLMGRVHDVEEAVEVVDQEETVKAERFRLPGAGQQLRPRSALAEHDPELRPGTGLFTHLWPLPW
jgi:hypothetical protein